MKRMLPRGTPILKCDEKPREKATLRGDSGAGLGTEWGVNSGGGRPAPEGRWLLKPPTCPPCSERTCPPLTAELRLLRGWKLPYFLLRDAT